jgi:hypothetical protein
MNQWNNMPNMEQMEQIESSIPKIIQDLPEGHFKGMVEQIEQVIDTDGKERDDIIKLVIRIAECGNHELIGQLMYYNVYVKDKQGRFNPRSYRFLAGLDESLKQGGAWHPSNLILIEFECKVEYSGKYWNLVNPVFIEKHEGYEL